MFICKVGIIITKIEGCEIMSKQSNQHYRKELEKKEKYSSKNGTETSDNRVSFENTDKDDTLPSSKDSQER